MCWAMSLSVTTMKRLVSSEHGIDLCYAAPSREKKSGIWSANLAFFLEMMTLYKPFITITLKCTLSSLKYRINHAHQGSIVDSGSRAGFEGLYMYQQYLP